MEKTKYHGVEFYLKNAPRSYPATLQQIKMKKVAEKCGIKKGISKRELMLAMKNCVGPAMRGENNNGEG